MRFSFHGTVGYYNVSCGLFFLFKKREGQVSKSGKAVSKAGQYVKKFKAAHATVTSHRKNRFSSSELQPHTHRATECLDERLKRKLAGHAIDPDVFLHEVLCFDHHAAGQIHLRQ